MLFKQKAKETKPKQMKRIMINAYQVGLVFKKGVYQKMVKEGIYWFWNGEAVLVYEMTKQFYPSMELNILLQDTELAEALHVVDVKENEIVLQFEHGLLKQVLNAGRYTFWKCVIDYEFVVADISKITIDENISKALLQHKLLATYVRGIQCRKL
jgi:hypothetical protein